MSLVSLLSPIPEQQIVSVSCADFDRLEMEVQSATWRKVLSTFGLRRKEFYVGALRHHSNPSFLSLSFFFFDQAAARE